MEIDCELCYMKVLAWKYPGDKVFFWINKLTQTSRDIILLYCASLVKKSRFFIGVILALLF